MYGSVGVWECGLADELVNDDGDDGQGGEIFDTDIPQNVEPSGERVELLHLFMTFEHKTHEQTDKQAPQR